MDKVWNKIESRSLVYGGAWEDAQSTIRAKTFEAMVILAKDRIKYYQSDLYHDALWINEYVVGPLEFEWVVRESGTHIGEITRYVKDDEWANSIRYRFDIRDDSDRKWVLDIHEAGPIVPVANHSCEECGVNSGAQWVDYMQMWLCSDYCTGKAENRLNKVCTSDDSNDHQGDTCPIHETDVDYSENEAYQLQLEKEDLGAKYRDAMQEEFQPYFSNEPLPESVEEAVANMDVNPIKDMIDMLFERNTGNIPTLGNESTMQRKENKLETILSDLRDKLDEANNTKDQLEEYQGNINDAVDELDTYVNDLEDLISSLDQLPEISVYVDLDTVSFDS